MKTKLHANVTAAFSIILLSSLLISVRAQTASTSRQIIISDPFPAELVGNEGNITDEPKYKDWFPLGVTGSRSSRQRAPELRFTASASGIYRIYFDGYAVGSATALNKSNGGTTITEYPDSTSLKLRIGNPEGSAKILKGYVRQWVSSGTFTQLMKFGQEIPLHAEILVELRQGTVYTFRFEGIFFNLKGWSKLYVWGDEEGTSRLIAEQL